METLPVRYDAARKALAECHRVDECQGWADKARALAVYAKQAKDTELQTMALRIQARAIRRCGELLREVEPNSGGRPRTKTREGALPSISRKSAASDAGLSEWQRKTALRIAAIPGAEFEARVESAKPPTVTGLAAYQGGGTPHVTKNSGENEWYTPAPLLDAARAVLGAFDLDPASTETANKTVRAANFFAAEEDGLAQEWHGRVWLNPPYAARLVDRFAEKLVNSLPTIMAAITLTNNATDTQWFQLLATHSAALCLLGGRVRFVSPTGESSAPLQGQAVLYFGTAVKKFIKYFSSLGICYVRAES